MPDGRVTIKIPRATYERVQGAITGSGFRSPTDFIVYVLREVLADRSLRAEHEEDDALTGPEVRAIRKRLKSLGYLK
jgi:hypothetical protein